MSGTIAPGFGGFAATPDGQAQYMGRAHNPYAFLQQDQLGQIGTAPAAADQMLARGGTVGLTPQQEMQWARFLKVRGNGGYRRGGRVLRLEDGGDTGGGDDAGSGAGGMGAGMGAADAAGGAAADAAGASMGGADGGFDGPGVNAGPAQAGLGGLSGLGSGLGAANAVGSTAAGVASQMGGGADPTLAQTVMSMAKAGVPGLGFIDKALGLSSKMGVAPEDPGAKFGSTVMGTLGMLGGPLGAMVGAGLGGYMGAHGTSDAGMSTSGSNAGLGSGVVQPQPPAGPDATQTAPDTDITGLIQRIRQAMGQGAQAASQGLAGGGSVQPGPSAGPNFHRGSGLIHGTSSGRADALPMHVPAGGYVVPADVVGGLGEGNTMAGAKRLRQMMPAAAPHLAGGGTVPVRLSAGEFYIHPAHVAALGGGDRKAGSDKLDEMVGHVRRINARQIASLPAPR